MSASEAPEVRSLQAALTDIFTTSMPLNRFLGLEVRSFDLPNPQFAFRMQPALVGNFLRRTLHGGVIAAVIDLTGGFAALLGIQARNPQSEARTILEHFRNLSTIDLRVDYLNPGLGQEFVATGSLLRVGKKVIVTRVEMHCDRQQLVATGTGAYFVG